MGGPGVVGRDDELRRLRAFVAARERLPAVAVLYGDAGIGKTTLWLAALANAGAHGFRVFRSRPSEAEAQYSFAGLADLLDGVVDEVLPALPVPQRQALEASLLLVGEPAATADERVVAAAFLSAVRALVDAGPVLVAVDDVQWLDAPSLAVLRFALGRLRAEPVAGVFAVRDDDVPAWVGRSTSEGRLEAIPVGPLSIGAVHELLRDRLEIVLPRPALVRIWEASGGNPLYALELARALQRRGGTIEPGAGLPIPVDLGGLLRERLDALSPAAVEVARIVAMLGEPTADVVERAVGPAADGLGEALDARILELDGRRLRFSHPLLASAVAAHVPPVTGRALHRRLADVVVAVEERARHLALAATEPDEAVAVVVERAARSAAARGATATAATLAEQALRLTPPRAAEGGRRRRLEAADWHFQAGDVPHALARLEEARLDTPQGPEAAAVLVRLARVHAETAGPAAAVALYREALGPAAGDDALVARIQLELGQFVRFTEGAEAALAHAEAAVEAAAQVDDAELNCRALASYCLVHFNAGRGIAHDAMERALALERSLSSRVTTPFLVHQLFWSGELRRARDVLERFIAWLAPRDDADAGSAQWYLALLEWRAGRWEEAARAAASAVAFDEQFGRETRTITSWPTAVIAAHRGDLGTARHLAERMLRSTVGVDVAVAGAEWVLGFADLSEDDPQAALPRIAHADEICAGLEIREPALHWFKPDLLDALLAVGDLERAEELVRTWEARARSVDRAWALAIAARTRAWIAAASGDLDGALAGFAEALAEHGRSEDPFQHARTLLAQGVIQRRAKRRGDARVTLQRALTGFEQVGAPLWAAKARAELGRIGGRAPSRGELTPSERRIAALVAEGRTNREVAAALFVTERTVEAALTRAYRKLGVRSRAELAHRLARVQP